MFKLTLYQKEKTWVFPYNRFVEYEKKDEEWARKLGFGHEEIIDKNFEMQNTSLVQIATKPDFGGRMITEITLRSFERCTHSGIF